MGQTMTWSNPPSFPVGGNALLNLLERFGSPKSRFRQVKCAVDNPLLPACLEVVRSNRVIALFGVSKK